MLFKRFSSLDKVHCESKLGPAKRCKPQSNRVPKTQLKGLIVDYYVSLRGKEEEENAWVLCVLMLHGS